MPPTLDNKEQGIHSLPAELICAIFSLIHASRSPPDEKPAALSPVHILNRVCRLWREISQDLPELWTDIRILHCRTGLPEMLDQYIRRSSNLQLDILLDIPLDVAGKQFVGFWAIILKLWSVAYRWRTLCIITTANNFAHIQANIGRKMVPRLESLQLRVSHAVPSGEIPPSISFSSMSALKSLVLHGIALQNSEVSSFVDQLERLDVNATSTVILLQLAEQFETSSYETQAISRLRYLSLRGSLPPLGVAADSAIKSYTSSLTSLYLGNFDRGDIHALCDVLSASALKELSLEDLSGSCWDDFTGALSVRTIEFPSLRTLKLARIRGYTMHGPGYLAVAFPFLERLSLLHVDCSTFLSSLSKADPIIWPRLNNLTVDNANYRTLRSVVEARSALGCPLASLEVDTPKIIDSSSLHWLQNHVSLKRNLRAA